MQKRLWDKEWYTNNDLVKFKRIILILNPKPRSLNLVERRSWNKLLFYKGLKYNRCLKGPAGSNKPFRKSFAKNLKVLKVLLVALYSIKIHRSVLEKIKFRYENNKEGMDDIFTYAINLGYEINVDTRIKCEHLYEKRPMKWGEGDLKY